MHNIQSPRDDDFGIEDMIQTAGAPAPRITPAIVEDAIVEEHCFTAADGTWGDWGTVQHANSPLHLLTFCVLVLRNGFTVTGESACTSPENFDAGIGQKIARANAVQKIWPLLGYELRSQLAQA